MNSPGNEAANYWPTEKTYLGTPVEIQPPDPNWTHIIRLFLEKYESLTPEHRALIGKIIDMGTTIPTVMGELYEDSHH